LSQEELLQQVSHELDRASKLKALVTLNVQLEDRVVRFHILEAYRYRKPTGGKGVMIACKVEDSATFHLWFDSYEDPRPKILKSVELWLRTRK